MDERSVVGRGGPRHPCSAIRFCCLASPPQQKRPRTCFSVRLIALRKIRAEDVSALWWHPSFRRGRGGVKTI